MNRRTILAASGGALSVTVAGCAGVLETGDGGDDNLAVEEVAGGFEHPWSLSVVPDESRLLVTEREGYLSVLDLDDGDVEDVDGTPDVYAEGQGGLLDAAFHPEFPDEPWLYLTYATVDGDGESTTALGRGELDLEAGSLEGFEQLYAVEPFVDSTQHYGSRVVFGDDGAVYATVGDRGSKEFGLDHYSQDTSTAIGSTLRLEPDGSIPDDNPFLDDEDVLDELYSYGHRNAQGMTVHPETGELWQSEHGEEDGDMLRIVEAGANHGWPIAHYGCEYGTDDPVGDGFDERDDVVDPVYYWECNSGGFPPAGMSFYNGDAFEEWEGDLFVGNLAGEYLGRFTVDGTDVEEVDPLLEGQGWRIRDVVTHPETGALYVAVDDADAPVVRLTPE
ncbi:PQQ-dependent sugar dehydrogenase [Natronococcus sp. A-GB1]|uniref:PQQ-dependent sugar dehydrogenase n=1 Tax=Natronococcus sp. A-GB1 TaxID=3037648 RepID=UPI0024203510|nr:PQQ-dependent sugar dehydrogenase [Natronococcus sp. A-GB1]MDG5758725.1 PQQ-dependent sugar dehydrogenase [Natronococcus sp. A-GB1]